MVLNNAGVRRGINSITAKNKKDIHMYEYTMCINHKIALKHANGRRSINDAISAMEKEDRVVGFSYNCSTQKPTFHTKIVENGLVYKEQTTITKKPTSYSNGGTKTTEAHSWHILIVKKKLLEDNDSRLDFSKYNELMDKTIQSPGSTSINIINNRNNKNGISIRTPVSTPLNMSTNNNNNNNTNSSSLLSTINSNSSSSSSSSNSRRTSGSRLAKNIEEKQMRKQTREAINATIQQRKKNSNGGGSVLLKKKKKKRNNIINDNTTSTTTTSTTTTTNSEIDLNNGKENYDDDDGSHSKKKRRRLDTNSNGTSNTGSTPHVLTASLQEIDRLVSDALVNEPEASATRLLLLKQHYHVHSYTPWPSQDGSQLVDKTMWCTCGHILRIPCNGVKQI